MRGGAIWSRHLSSRNSGYLITEEVEEAALPHVGQPDEPHLQVRTHAAKPGLRTIFLKGPLGRHFRAKVDGPALLKEERREQALILFGGWA